MMMFKITGPKSASLWGLTYGVLLGNRDALFMPMFADLFGTNNLGKISGINTSLNLITMGLGPLLFGLSKDYTGSYLSAITASAVLNLIFSLMLFCSKVPEDEPVEIKETEILE